MSTEPLFLSCSEIDHTFDSEARNEALTILQEEKKAYNFQVFSGVEHGFALRGNMDNPYERRFPAVLSWVVTSIDMADWAPGYAKEESLRSIAQWFDFWLSQ